MLELVAGFSLFAGGGFGRWVGIFAAALAAISALLSIPAYPFWSLCVFALSLIILYSWPRHRWRRQQRLQPNAPRVLPSAARRPERPEPLLTTKATQRGHKRQRLS